MSATEIGLFMGAPPIADYNPAFVRDDDEIEVAHTSDRDADVREATARVVAVYERYVRQYPEQWFNFFDFWNPPQPPRPTTSTTSTTPPTPPTLRAGARRT